MRIFFLVLIFITTIFTQFKSDRQNKIESSILAPCCYGGIVAEHNSMLAKLISNIINSLIDDNKDKDDIIEELNQLVNISISNDFLTNNKLNYNFKNLIHSNMNDDEILKLFIEIYGEKIRAIPQDNIFGKLTWLAPFIIIIIGVVLISFVIFNLSSNNQYILTKHEMLNIEEKIENFK